MEPQQRFRLVGVGLSNFFEPGGPLRPTRIVRVTSEFMPLYNMTAYYN
jgi:hypothetical protein